MSIQQVLRRLLLPALLAGSATVLAQTPPSTQRYTPNFRDTDIAAVAEVVAQATGKTFIIDPRVRATVSVTSSKSLTADELYQVFLSVLQVHGFAAVPTGNLVKIVMDAGVRTVPGNDLPTSLSDSDEMVTQVIAAKNVSAAQLATVLRPLIAQYGNLAPVPGTNTLIITDRASNVQRIMRIINRVDQGSDANVEIIQLQNSTAADVVRTMTALTVGAPGQDAGGAPPRVVADERSNSVLISGDSAQRLRISTLIAHLDTPVENGGDTQVIYLRYANAEKIAPKLKEQMTGVVAAAGATGGAAAAAIDRSTTIWPEPETNALVITAPPKTMRSLRTIIDRIDIRRAQVMLEAIVVDVSTNNSADLGVNWAMYTKESGAEVPAGAFITPIGAANNNPVSIVDLAKAVRDPASATTVPLGATFAIGSLSANGLNFAAMIRALRADANTNVIATPSTVTMDNQEAELKVAQEVPFITGQYTTSGGGTTGGGTQPNPFTTVEREEVGLILKITPQINGGDAMMLKIELESSELTGTAGDAGSLITNKRSIKTSILIDDGATVVIAGLIRDAKTEGESRVPFLGRIPIIGEAFRVRSGKREKTNLMVFIRPKILHDAQEAAYETNAKYNNLRELQQRMGLKQDKELIELLPGDNPLLPPAPPVPTTVTEPAADRSNAEPKAKP